MIVFKQKEFWVGTALTVGSTALGLKQGADASKQQEEIADQQRRSEAKTRAALEKLANSGASPEQKSEAASLFSERRLFAAPGSVLKNVGGLAKDLWAHSGGGVKKAAKLSAGFAAAGYVGNRVATSMKDHDEGNDKKTGKFLAKAAGTAAVVGGGIMAARKGAFNKVPGLKGAQNFMTTGYGGRALRAGKSILKENVSPIKRKENGKIGINGSGAMGLAFGMTPAISYLAQKKSQRDMVNNTQEEGQQQYSLSFTAIKGAFKGAAKSTGNAAKRAFNKDTTARTWTGGFNKVANFFGMMGGKGGTTAVQEGAKNLLKQGQKSGNKYTQNLANWAIKNPNKANVAAGAATIAVGSTAMGLGAKMVEKPLRAFDRDAYKMEDKGNDKI